MTEIKLRQIGIWILLCAINSSIAWGIINYHQKKIAVIDAVKLFNEYQMKKDIEGEASIKLRRIATQIDSVGKLIKMQKAGTEEYKHLSLEYQAMNEQLDYEYTRSDQEINQIIWKRLNPLIDKYAEEKNFHLVIGANGMGSVLYQDEYYDHTKELIQYVNKNYENNR